MLRSVGRSRGWFAESRCPNSQNSDRSSLKLVYRQTVSCLRIPVTHLLPASWAAYSRGCSLRTARNHCCYCRPATDETKGETLARAVISERERSSFTKPPCTCIAVSVANDRKNILYTFPRTRQDERRNASYKINSPDAGDAEVAASTRKTFVDPVDVGANNVLSLSLSLFLFLSRLSMSYNSFSVYEN